jgi:hypothetical protein
MGWGTAKVAVARATCTTHTHTPSRSRGERARGPTTTTIDRDDAPAAARPRPRKPFRKPTPPLTRASALPDMLICLLPALRCVRALAPIPIPPVLPGPGARSPAGLSGHAAYVTPPPTPPLAPPASSAYISSLSPGLTTPQRAASRSSSRRPGLQPLAFFDRLTSRSSFFS